MSNGIIYTASTVASGTTFTSAGSDRDIVQIGGSTNSIGIIHEVRIGMSGEAGDAEAEMLHVEWFRATTLGAGTAGVEEPMVPAGGRSDMAADLVTVFNAAVSSGLTILGADSFNVQAGWLYLPTPETRLVVPIVATEGIVFQVQGPNDDLQIHASIVWEEIGVT